MWPFNRERNAKKPLLAPGFVDWHSHILPGVDDGVQTMDEALEILGCYERLGIGEVWLTPHIMEDIPNTTGDLRSRFAELQAAYEGPVRLRLAAENMLDNLFEERLEAGDLLPLGEAGDALLVETSYLQPPVGLGERLERIRKKGFTPVLAHPERYLYMSERDYQALKQAGTAFQLNVASLAGTYGKHVCANAERLRRKGWYEYAGTDLHNLHMMHKILK